MTVILANDIDRDAAATYRKHRALLASEALEFIEGDVADIEELPQCDIAIGCYPCQSFTMGGPRSPGDDPRTELYEEFARCLGLADPKYFVAENVPGLRWLQGGAYYEKQLAALQAAGSGYRVSARIVNARDFGVPAHRKRLFFVGVREDLDRYYWFKEPTHGPPGSGLRPYASHGEAILSLPLDGSGEYYSNPPTDSWWYMSRRRRREWGEPSLTIVGNWRHVPLHPASPPMRMSSSDLANGWRQDWEFVEQREDVGAVPPKLASARRLTWRECALIQTFPPEFEPVGSISSKFRQIGNAVPPMLMQAIIEGIVDGTALRSEAPPYAEVGQ